MNANSKSLGNFGTLNKRLQNGLVAKRKAFALSYNYRLNAAKNHEEFKEQARKKEL